MKVHLPNGVIAEVENEQDLKLLQQLQASIAPTAVSNGAYAGEARTPAPRKGGPQLGGELVRIWRERLNPGGQSDLVQLLTNAPDGLTDVQLRSELNFSKNVQLAGILGAVSRHAQAIGLKPKALVEKITNPDPDGDWKYRYRLKREVRTALLNG